ncbi:MAG: endonuclease III [Candidatus Sungbacteria bacterium]|uniref:Endonuclease III n=1 Tax=Candidatus Sungiibacteriota bacterium TaxID=2750080 RepID=A0A931YDW0_9BACT|nr:endonuclease III [Candidatus Sungbacteria bacterium]MBI2466083.1 endonuclease III [Candidatus Sungbacteria bacterium]
MSFTQSAPPLSKSETAAAKRKRALKIVKFLKSKFPDAKIALNYQNPIQLLVAVILSAQCTDKKVNEVTENIFEKYKTAADFAALSQKQLEKMVHACGFYRNKAKNIIAACKIIQSKFQGQLPQTMADILTLPGVARKTANVVLGNAWGVVEGIAVDTHMIRLNQKLGFTRESNPVKIERDLMQIIPKEDWFSYTYGIIDYGRRVCSARHKKCDCEIYKIR